MTVEIPKIRLKISALSRQIVPGWEGMFKNPQGEKYRFKVTVDGRQEGLGGRVSIVEMVKYNGWSSYTPLSSYVEIIEVKAGEVRTSEYTGWEIRGS